MTILIQCTDRRGLIAHVTQLLVYYDLNILTLREFVEEESNLLFAKFVCTGEADLNKLTAELQAGLPDDAIVRINPNPIKHIAVFVTKEHHCLADILIRNHFKTLGAEVVCVIGNHDNLQDLCQRFSVPFFLVSHIGKSKDEYERELLACVSQFSIDYIVLAKYMRILSPWFISHFPLQIINIHHSFLPAFIGANPYQQAYDRGVKLIGATAHYVTNDLDEGPIIVQKTTPVNHTFSASDMRRTGREIESAALAEGLSLVLQDRVFVTGNKTIVFKT